MADLNNNLELIDQVHQLLQETPTGLSEYQLIQTLKQRRSTHIPHQSLTDPLVLYRTHFLLFNALYRLRDQLQSEQHSTLQISPLQIQLQPWQAAEQALSEHDELRCYYLDEHHLRDIQLEQVERLLASFWERMQGSEEQLAALELFELQNECNLSAGLIKQRYRRLVSLHHPDRGGSTHRLQSINLAMEILGRYYS